MRLGAIAGSALGQRVARALAVAVGLAVLGLLMGWVWFRLAPRYVVQRVDGGYIPVHTEPTEVVGAEVYFAIMGLAVGLIAAALAWGLLWRWRGIEMLAGLTVGGIACGYVAWRFGVALAGGDARSVLQAAQVGTLVTVPLHLRLATTWAGGIVALPAFAAALLYTAFAAFSPYAGLVPEDIPEGGPADGTGAAPGDGAADGTGAAPGDGDDQRGSAE